LGYVVVLLDREMRLPRLVTRVVHFFEARTLLS